MKKYILINRYLHDQLPEPETTADEAWKEMAGKLNAFEQNEIVYKRPERPFETTDKLALKLKKIPAFASLVILICLIAVWLTYNIDADINKTTHTFKALPKVPDPAVVVLSKKASISEKKRTKKNFRKETKYTDKDIIKFDKDQNELTVGISGPRATFPATAHKKTFRAFKHYVEKRKSHNQSAEPISSSGKFSNLAGARFPLHAEEFLDHKKSVGNQSPVETLSPISGNFKSKKIDLSRLIKKPVPQISPTPKKSSRTIFEGISFGPEWRFSTGANAKYLFKGVDNNLKQLAKLAIPGVYLSKNWYRHTVGFIFLPLHTYLGNDQVVDQTLTRKPTPDGTYIDFYNNTNFIKAAGLNFSTQYQYQTTSWLSASTEVSYAKYSSAMLQKETVTGGHQGILRALSEIKNREALEKYISPKQWSVSGGILFHPQFMQDRHLQVGVNLTVPVSDLSRDQKQQIRSLNAQLYLRLLLIK